MSRAGWTGLMATVLVTVLVAAGCMPAWMQRPPPLPIDAPAEPSALVGCDQADTRLVVTESSHLDPSCTYTRGIDVKASDVVLDCQGARIERGLEVTAEVGIALVIGRDEVRSNVTIRNCVVSDFTTNLRIRRNGAAQLPEGQEYDAGFSNVNVENSQFYDATRDGIFVDWYVTGVTLRFVEVAGSAAVGVYFDPGSTGNVLEHSVIHRNGFGDVSPDGVPVIVDGIEFRYSSTGREGVALDGAWENTIRDNWIAGNSAGGVFLYKNCGEHADVNRRRTGADANVIERNLIGSEKTGVWVGSRMAENQYFMECADPAYVDEPFRKVHLDHAAGNTIRDNTFWTVDYGTRVEDDNTSVNGNHFISADSTDRAVVIGTKERAEHLGSPTSGTVVSDNSSTIAGSPTPFQTVWPHASTMFADNTASGSPTVLVEGVPPPINPFLFAISVWIP